MSLRIGDIAVVGMACRFPGVAHSPNEFWKILKSGRDVVGEVGPDRWNTDYYYHSDPKAPGKSYTFSAGLIDDVESFDAQFFGISPREAAQMDPQQRLLLELAWEALEDGGALPSRLAGSNCGVFIGISNPDFVSSRIEDLSTLDAYSMTGGSLSIAANRISYCLDLRGPSMSIDTACSSSLVALHQACESIRRGETSTALVGGVNVLLSPFSFIGFSRASMLSPTGRCRAFDAAADGYVRAEGGVALFIKPLAKAKADGDPVHAVILGTGVNSDGHTHGMSLPSSEAQQRLLHTVYEKAGIAPDELVYLEAHGTGTPAGDPQEADAIGRVLATRRTSRDPLMIGSVKTNVGHLEAAAGLAGLAKVVLSLEHRGVPASLHFNAPNPEIPFSDLNIQVVSEFTSLPEDGKRAIMGINSFGFGGTNAHAILGESPHAAARRPARAKRALPPLFISARSQPALVALAGAYADTISALSPAEYNDLAYTAAARRQHHNHRLAMPGADSASMAQRLRGFAANGRAENVVSDQAIATPARVAFVFSGNGSQWPGMGKRLLAENRVFRSAVEKVDALLHPLAGFSVVDALRAKAAESHLHLTEVAQPALFALQVGLIEALCAKGLQPDMVLGHSVGEITAAYAAGALSLEQAVLTIYARSTAQAPTRGLGRMAAVALPVSQIESELNEFDGQIELAAVNSPGSVTVSGSLGDLQALATRIESRGLLFRMLDFEYAFHSRFMEPVRVPLEEMLAALAPSPTRLPFVSTVTGTIMDGLALGSTYWWSNVRLPVRFDRAIETIASEEPYVYLEIGPHPILQGYIRENLNAAGRNGRAISTLKKNGDAQDRLMEALCESHVSGASLDAKKLFPKRARCVSLPTYPWQRENHWYPSTDEQTPLLKPEGEHPLLGFRVPHVEHVWENLIDTVRLPYLADHVIGEAVVFPASAFMEMALAAAAECPAIEGQLIEGLEIVSPLVLVDGVPKVVRFSLTEDDNTFYVRSRDRLSDDQWTLNATGRLGRRPSSLALPPVPLPSGPDIRFASMVAEDHYRLAAEVGLRYGPAFRTLAQLIKVADERAIARIEQPDWFETAGDTYHVHPTVLDACLQSLIGVLSGRVPEACAAAYLPQQLERFELFGDGRAIRYSEVVVRYSTDRSVVADFKLTDVSGNVVAQAEGFRFRRVRLSGDEPSLFEFRAILTSTHDGDTPAPITAPDALAARASAVLEGSWRALRRAEYYKQFLMLLDGLICAHAFEALRAIGVPGGTFTMESLMQATGIPRDCVPRIRKLLEFLREDGIATQRDGEWLLPEESPLPDSTAIWRRMVADFPAYVPELTVVGRRGRHLLAWLQGEDDAAALLSPTRGSSAANHVFRTSPSVAMLRPALQSVVREIARAWPSNRRLRILEITDGFNSVAVELVDRLSIDLCDYVVAVPDGESRAQQASAFAAAANVSVIELDLAGEPAQREIPSETFDVTIIPATLREPRVSRAIFENARRLMSSGGLLLLEGRARDRFVDFVFGVDSDERFERVSVAAKRTLLAECGLTDIVSVTEPVPMEDTQGYLFIARSPSRPADTGATQADSLRRILLVSDISGDSTETSERLSESLTALGHQVVNVRVGEEFREIAPDHYEIALRHPRELEDLCRTIGAGGNPCTEVIQLAGFSMEGDLPDVDLMAVQERRCAVTLHLVQAILKAEWPISPRLWLVTCRALAPSCYRQDFPRQIPSQSPLWGLGRVLMNEHPELRCRLVDLHVAEDPIVAARLLVGELSSSDDENEIVLTPDRRYAMRACKANLEVFHCGSAGGASDGGVEPVRLEYRASGFDHLEWRRYEQPPLGKDEVAIRPRATGLNFRDVMFCMGMLPDEAAENGFAGPNLGMECAGNVTAVGCEVRDLKPGDAVLALAASSFGSHVVTKATATARKPSEWSYEAAAGVPVAFFTAYYALKQLGELSEGDRVLIHGAAGGVGLAAIQYARHRGAEIFATAGSDEKRDFLHLLGVEHLFDSRSLTFADEIRALTGGAGVDIVLNSLWGEAVSKNLGLLRPFGRLLELGKRDYFENTKIGLRPFRNNIMYFGIDVDQLVKERPELAARLFGEIMDLFAAGVFWPLPHCVFSNARVVDAFRHMQQSRHIGKIVVAHDDAPANVRKLDNAQASFSVRSDSTYVIAGGLGGFGLATARWLASKGARNLVLIGRSGLATQESREIVSELEAAGVRVQVARVDICDALALSDVFKDLASVVPPIRGIVHSAMTLDDGPIQDIAWDGFARVLEPKVLGAWNLHRQSLGMSLDFFVLYSSATTSIGNPGQANYVAGNMFLESLASHRRSTGLPALAVCWGPIDDVGYLSRNAATKDSLTSRLGGRALSAEKALRMLERLMLADRTGVAVAGLNWYKASRSLPILNAPKFSLLVRDDSGDINNTGTSQSILELVDGMSDEQIHLLVTELLSEQIATVLRMPVKQVNVERSIFELGMDSLMVVELQVAIESRFGVSLPVMVMNGDTSIGSLARQIARQLEEAGVKDDDPEPNQDRAFIESLSSRHGESLTDDALDVLMMDSAKAEDGAQ